MAKPASTTIMPIIRKKVFGSLVDNTPSVEVEPIFEIKAPRATKENLKQKILCVGKNQKDIQQNPFRITNYYTTI